MVQMLSVELKTPEEFVRFEVFTAVTMKNAVFWDIKTQLLQKTHYISSTELSRLILCKI
jgi:hypothetical protein